MEAITSYVQPEDTVIDVGGGAGRVSLPLALCCQEVINVATRFHSNQRINHTGSLHSLLYGNSGTATVGCSAQC